VLRVVNCIMAHSRHPLLAIRPQTDIRPMYAQNQTSVTSPMMMSAGSQAKPGNR
jgi:hypothetical protein